MIKKNCQENNNVCTHLQAKKKKQLHLAAVPFGLQLSCKKRIQNESQPQNNYGNQYYITQLTWQASVD